MTTDTKTKPKILLTNCLHSPYEGWADDQLNALLSSQLKKQGAFGFIPRQHTMGLYVIAENVPAASTILEFPPEELFVEELKKGYDYLGIQVIATNLQVVKEMVRLAREIAPETKIVVGGYGAASLVCDLPHDPGGCAEYVRTNVDHVCGGDGVAFFRELLGAPTEEEVTQHYMPFNDQAILGLGYLHGQRIPSLLAALGCPNGCEFCVTSAFYDQKKHRVVTPEQLVDYIQSMLRRLGRHNPAFFVIYDEDFLTNRKYVLEVGELLRERGIYKKVSLWCFASIRSISQYSMEELVRCGIGTIFVGLESKLLDQDKESYHQVFHKRAGKDPSDIFAELYRHGIMTVISTVFGWDFHTKDNLQTDVDYLISLKSPFYQIAPLTPYPGTPMFKRLVDEGRIYDDFSWRDVCFWNSDVFRPANFEKGEVRANINATYDKIYEANGPSVLSILDIFLQGYHTLSQSSDPFLQQRAKRLALFCRNMRHLLYSMRRLAPNPAVRERVEEIEDRFARYLGRPNLWLKGISRLLYRKILPVHKRIQNNGGQVEVEIPWKVIRYDGPKEKPKEREQHPVKTAIHRMVSNVVSNT